MKEYTVTIGGVEHTMLLDEEDAKRYETSEATDTSEADTKSSTPSNKSRTSSGK